MNDGTVRANQTCSVLGLGDRASLKIELSDRVLGALRLLNRHCIAVKRRVIFKKRLDGWQAAIALRANPKTKMIPILATSADISPRDLAACLEAGCNGYIVKPFSVVDLHIKIREMLAAPFAAEV